MSTPAVPTNKIVRLGLLAIVGPALAAYLTWVDFSGVGIDIEWNGLGWVSGDEAQYAADVGAAINPLGWVIVAAMAFAGGLLIASAFVMPVLLRYAAGGFALIALAVAVTCLVNPSVLLGDLLSDFGVSAIDPGQVVVTSWIWGEIVLTGMFVMTVVLLEVGRRRT